MEESEIPQLRETAGQRAKGIYGDLAVHCQVTDRWLRFPRRAGFGLGPDELIEIDVMTDASGGEKSRRLCSLVLSKDDLLRALATVRYGSREAYQHAWVP